MQRQSDKLSKLATIKGILNGSLSIKDLLPQQIYFINIIEDVYEISETGRDFGKGKKMNKDEFEKWKVTNYRKDVDVLFITKNDKELKEELNELIKEYRLQEHTQEPKEITGSNQWEPTVLTETSTDKEPVFEFPIVEPIKQAVKEAKEPDVKKIEAKEIIEPEPTKRTWGKLSEYGIIWECQRN